MNSFIVMDFIRLMIDLLSLETHCIKSAQAKF
jgi:hypothetical protein